MFKKAYAKLKNNNGESLAEVLITVLIIALGLALLASLIMGAGHMMDKGEENMQELYIGANNIEAEAGAGENTEMKSEEMVIEDSNGMSLGRIYVDVYEDKASGLKAYYKSSGTP